MLAHFWPKIGSPDALWDDQLVSSRLLECNVWNCINAHHLQNSHGEAARNLIGRVAMVEMGGPVLTRALQPFSVPVRTPDPHLAAFELIRARRQSVQLAAMMSVFIYGRAWNYRMNAVRCAA